jgi:hypothetical protein
MLKFKAKKKDITMVYLQLGGLPHTLPHPAPLPFMSPTTNVNFLSLSMLADNGHYCAMFFREGVVEKANPNPIFLLSSINEDRIT